MTQGNKNLVPKLLGDVQKEIKTEDELDYFFIHRSRYQFILEQILDLGLPKGAKILDVGCFPLHLFRALELAGFEVFGISSKHEPVKQKNIVSVNVETDDLPFKKESFDLILFTEVMEHLLYDPKIYLQKFWEILRPLGYLLVTTPNAVHLKHRLQAIFGKSSFFPLFQLYESRPENNFIYHRHNREYILSELRQILTEAKFKVIQGNYFSAYSPWRKRLHQSPLSVRIIKGLIFLPTYFFGPIKDTLFLLAQKHD